MKKLLFVLMTAVSVYAVVTISSCKKDDTTPPVISMSGSNPMTIVLNSSSVSDPGATANDDEDGAISSVSSNWNWGTNPDPNTAGNYSITYTASDAAGNQATAVRTVTVYNQAAAIWEGTYNGSEVDINGPYTYTQQNVVTASTTQNNRITLTRLGDFANNTVFMDVTGNNLNMPSQTHTNVGTGPNPCDVHDRTSSGTGVKTTQGFTLTYDDAKVAPCTGSRTGVVATFIKQ
jgi:Bacterial surface protein, Ig-like domain